MFNTKLICFGLLGASLGALAFPLNAQAYKFNFLGAQSSGDSVDWTFEFVSEGISDTVKTGDELKVEGFQQVEGASLTAPKDVNGAVDARTTFNLNNFTNTEVNYTVAEGVNSTFPLPLKFQTFSVRAASVPTGFVQAYYKGTALNPTAVPEPFTIIGSLAALGFGVFGQREFSKRQNEAVEKA